jgi:hypothetical protein
MITPSSAPTPSSSSPPLDVKAAVESWRRDIARYVAYRQRRFRAALSFALAQRGRRGRR